MGISAVKSPSTGTVRRPYSYSSTVSIILTAGAVVAGRPVRNRYLAVCVAFKRTCVRCSHLPASTSSAPHQARRNFVTGRTVRRYNWHSAGSLGWPFPMINYKYIFQIKHTVAILPNSTRKLLWFEISKMLIAVKKIIYCVVYYNFRHTFVPCRVLVSKLVSFSVAKVLSFFQNVGLPTRFLHLCRSLATLFVPLDVTPMPCKRYFDVQQSHFQKQVALKQHSELALVA